MVICTLPETNISENQWLGAEISFWDGLFALAKNHNHKRQQKNDHTVMKA